MWANDWVYVVSGAQRQPRVCDVRHRARLVVSVRLQYQRSEPTNKGTATPCKHFTTTELVHCSTSKLSVIFYSAVISIHMVTGKLEIDNKDNKITKTGTDRRHRSTNLPAVLIHGALLRFDTHTDTRHDLYSGRFFFTKFSALVELWLRMINLKLVFRSLKGRCHGKQFLLAFSTELSCDDSR